MRSYISPKLTNQKEECYWWAGHTNKSASSWLKKHLVNVPLSLILPDFRAFVAALEGQAQTNSLCIMPENHTTSLESVFYESKRF